MEPTRTTGEHANSIKHLAPREFKPGTLMRATAVTRRVVLCSPKSGALYAKKASRDADLTVHT